MQRRLILTAILATTACSTDGVQAGAVATITVIPDSRDLVAGQVQGFPLIFRDNDGNVIESAPPVTWHSANPAVAIVNDSGFVTGVHTGVTTVTVTSGAAHGTTQITVNQGGMVTADSGIIYSDDHTLWVTRFAGSFGLGALTIRKLPTPATANAVPGSAWAVEVAGPANYYWITLPYQPSSLPAGTNPLHLQLLNLRTGTSLGGNITDTVQHTVTLETLEGSDSFAIVPVPLTASRITVAGPDTMHVGQTWGFGVDASGADIAGFGVTWSCSDTTVLDCGRYGVFNALTPGTVTITARLAELVATKTVTVSP